MDGNPPMSMSDPNSVGSNGKLQGEVKESFPKSKKGNGW